VNRTVLTIIGAALVSSCTVGPNYKRPVVQPPSAFRSDAAPGAESLADLKWFNVFRDDTLTGLVTTALKQNFELRIAAERVCRLARSTGSPALIVSRKSTRRST